MYCVSKIITDIFLGKILYLQVFPLPTKNLNMHNTKQYLYRFMLNVFYIIQNKTFILNILYPPRVKMISER